MRVLQQKGIYTYLVSTKNFLFHFPFDEIHRRLLFFYSRAFCFRVNRLFHSYMKPSNTKTSGKTTDMIAGICTFPRLPCPSTKRHVMLNLTSAAAAAAAAAATALRTAGWSCSVFFFSFQLSCESYMVMDVVVQNPQKSSGYDQGTTMRKDV